MTRLPGAAPPATSPGESKPVPDVRAEPVSPDQPDLPFGEGAHGASRLEPWPKPKRLRWVCSSEGGYCGNLACKSNIAGVEVTDSGSIVVGRMGGGDGGEPGVVIHAEESEGMAGHDGLFERAAALSVDLQDRCVEALGTVCMNELGGRSVKQQVVGRLFGMARQGAASIERTALRKQRAKYEELGIRREVCDDEPDVLVALRGRRRSGL